MEDTSSTTTRIQVRLDGTTELIELLMESDSTLDYGSVGWRKLFGLDYNTPLVYREAEITDAMNINAAELCMVLNGSTKIGEVKRVQNVACVIITPGGGAVPKMDGKLRRMTGAQEKEERSRDTETKGEGEQVEAAEASDDHESCETVERRPDTPYDHGSAEAPTARLAKEVQDEGGVQATWVSPVVMDYGVRAEDEAKDPMGSKPLY